MNLTPEQLRDFIGGECIDADAMVRFGTCLVDELDDDTSDISKFVHAMKGLCEEACTDDELRTYHVDERGVAQPWQDGISDTTTGAKDESLWTAPTAPAPHDSVVAEDHVKLAGLLVGLPEKDLPKLVAFLVELQTSDLAKLVEFLDELTHDDRRIAILTLLGLKSREIARRIGKTEGLVRLTKKANKEAWSKHCV